MFERLRLATPAEIAALIASFDVIDPPAILQKAEVSSLTLEQLAGAQTVLALPAPAPSAERFYTLAECAASWAGGGGTAHDQESYQRALRQAADPAFAPEILFAPTSLTSSGWWMVDGVHRAAALVTKRAATDVTALDLRVFVLPRPL